MAEKRAKVRLVRGVLGLTEWLATEEEMEAAAQREGEKPMQQWTRAANPSASRTPAYASSP